jgi:hypothetical protein
MGFFKSAEQSSLEKTDPISTLKHLDCRKYSFEKLTQCSNGNNMLDTPPSNTYFSSERYMCFFNLAA